MVRERFTPLKARRLSFGLIGAAAVTVLLVGLGVPGVPGSPSASPSTGPSTLSVWDEASYQGDLLGGVNRSVVISVPPLPSENPTVYVDGSFSMLSSTYYTHGLFNESGVCANSFSLANACAVYFGVWTNAAWSAYLQGGPMDPVWCFPGNSPGCANASVGELGTPNLNSLDGTGWQIVLWNLGSFELSGTYQFTVYASAPPP